MGINNGKNSKRNAMQWIYDFQAEKKKNQNKTENAERKRRWKN